MDLFPVFSGDGASGQSDFEEEHDDDDIGSVSNLSTPSTSWSFGGLIKTLATKSESVISNYRRDLEELGSGLRKETSVIREVASRAVKDLPTTLDVGASVAQESLESVGQAIDDIGTAVWKSTSKIISHGRDTFLASDLVSENHENNSNIVISSNQLNKPRNLEFKQYNRFNTQLIAIQRDLNTYLEEPNDIENYKNWKLGFVLEEKEKEIEDLVKESEDVRETYRTVVPSRISHDVFWSRYFYSFHKLKQAEEARVKLVKRAISAKDEEELSWDVEEDDDKEEGVSGESSENGKTGEGNVKKIDIDDSLKKMGGDGRGESGDSSCKDSDISIISSQGGEEEEEEEVGWDEIEEIGTVEEAKGKVFASGSVQKFGLNKKLSVAEEEEDLSWDIEDEDEPTKS
ncbi:protein DOS2 [Cucumis melo var. makuwa]|uniref:Protein DOS2 n=2 Tax=Cucumis melo TaxID=3656 RepID=A0A5A7U0Q2_CUCMM|nr:protein DOS2 [Cucumis melo]KAA0049413.1 protein DOS2 [Cucumis melo var. makuwa]TYK16091.1 protein DOS2 [Cucumis melo var. makuwa]